MRRNNFEGETGKPYRDTAVICANKAEPIEVPFRLWARMGPKHHVLHGRSRSPVGKGHFRWIGAPIVKYRHFVP